MNIYYFIVSVHRESGEDSSVSFGSGYLTRLQSVSAGAANIKDSVGWSHSKLTHMFVGKTQILLGYWTESLKFSLAVGQRPP